MAIHCPDNEASFLDTNPPDSDFVSPGCIIGSPQVPSAVIRLRIDVYVLGAGLGAWLVRSPPAIVAWVRIPEPASCKWVEFVVGSRLAPRVFSGFSGFPPSAKKNPS